MEITAVTPLSHTWIRGDWNIYFNIYDPSQEGDIDLNIYYSSTPGGKENLIVEDTNLGGISFTPGSLNQNIDGWEDATVASIYGWTTVGGTPVISTAQKHTGTYSLLLNNGESVASTADISISGVDVNYEMWIWSGNAGASNPGGSYFRIRNEDDGTIGSAHIHRSGPNQFWIGGVPVAGSPVNNTWYRYVHKYRTDDANVYTWIFDSDGTTIKAEREYAAVDGPPAGGINFVENVFLWNQTASSNYFDDVNIAYISADATVPGPIYCEPSAGVSYIIDDFDDEDISDWNIQRGAVEFISGALNPKETFRMTKEYDVDRQILRTGGDFKVASDGNRGWSLVGFSTDGNDTPLIGIGLYVNSTDPDDIRAGVWSTTNGGASGRFTFLSSLVIDTIYNLIMDLNKENGVLDAYVYDTDGELLGSLLDENGLESLNVTLADVQNFDRVKYTTTNTLALPDGSSFIVDDLIIDYVGLGDNNFTTERSCTYSIDTTGIPDGNWYFDVSGIGSPSDTNYSFAGIDNNAPFGTVDNNGLPWHTEPFDVIFDVNFGPSGDGNSSYKLDGSAWTNFPTGLVLLDSDGTATKGIWTDENYIFVARGGIGLSAYTFDGVSISHVATTDVGGSYQDVWGDGTYIYATNDGYGIIAYDFNGTDFNFKTNSDDTIGSYPLGIWGDGTYIYVAGRSDGIYAYSFDGSDFSLLKQRDDGGRAHEVWGDGTYIYLANNDLGIYAYDFNGVDFNVRGIRDDGDAAWGVWGNGTYVFLANLSGGLLAYDFNGVGFTLHGSTTEEIYTYQVTGDGNKIYTVNDSDDKGVYAYDFNGDTFILDSNIYNGNSPRYIWSDGNYIYSGTGGALRIYDDVTNYYHISITTDGNHTIDYNFTDNAGNSTYGVVQALLDATAPVYDTVINAATWMASPFYIILTGVTDATSGIFDVWVAEDGGDFVDANYIDTNVYVDVNMDGNHQYDFWIRDNAGNDYNVTYFGYLDQNGPVVTIDGNGSPWKNYDFNIVFDVNFLPSGEKNSVYRREGGAWTTFTWDFNIEILTDGMHTIDFNFTDNSDNFTTGTIYALHDITAPIYGSINNPGETWQTSTFNVDINDINFGDSGFFLARYSIDDTGFINMSPVGDDYSFQINTDGNHDINIWLRDLAGNDTNIFFYSARDATAPVVGATTITAGTGGSLSGSYFRGLVNVIGGVAVDATSGIDTATCEYLIDSTWTAGTWNANHCETSDKAAGWDANVAVQKAYTFNTRVYDIAGNLGTGTIGTYYMDTNAPDTNALTYQISTTDLNVIFGCYDSNSGCRTIYYNVDDGAWTSLTTPAYFTTISPGLGKHTINYYAIDNVDNNEMTKLGTFRSLDTNLYGQLIINIKDENTGLDVDDVSVLIGSTTYTVDHYRAFDLNVINSGYYSLMFTKSGYATRYYDFDLNNLVDYNIRFLMIGSTRGTNQQFKMYDYNEIVTLPNSYTEFIRMDWNVGVDGWTAGRRKADSLGEFYQIISNTDSNYDENILKANGDTNRYVPVLLQILKPRDEVTLALIDQNWRLDFKTILVKFARTIIDDYNTFILPNVKSPYKIQIVDMNDVYFERTYSSTGFDIDGNQGFYQLQPYLVSSDDGEVIKFITKTPAGLEVPNVSINIFKNTGAGRVLFGSLITDYAGVASMALVAGEEYELDIYYNGQKISNDDFVLEITDTTYYITINTLNYISDIPIINVATVLFTPGTEYLQDSATYIKQTIDAKQAAWVDINVWQWRFDINHTEAYEVMSATTYCNTTCDNTFLLTDPDFNRSLPLYVRVVVKTDSNSVTQTFSMRYITSEYGESTGGIDLFGLFINAKADFGCDATWESFCPLTIIISILVAIFAVGGLMFKFGFQNPMGMSIIAGGILVFATAVGWFHVAGLIIIALLVIAGQAGKEVTH